MHNEWHEKRVQGRGEWQQERSTGHSGTQVKVCWRSTDCMDRAGELGTVRKARDIRRSAFGLWRQAHVLRRLQFLP